MMIIDGCSLDTKVHGHVCGSAYQDNVQGRHKIHGSVHGICAGVWRRPHSTAGPSTCNIYVIFLGEGKLMLYCLLKYKGTNV